jgi:hypothetical protein
MPDRVIRAITPHRTYGEPVSPAPFPTGEWEIIGPEHWEGAYSRQHFGNIKLLTNAWQHLEVWELDERGAYQRPAGRRTVDTGYCLHFSDFKTSLGCLITGNAAWWSNVLAEITAELARTKAPVPLIVEA